MRSAHRAWLPRSAIEARVAELQLGDRVRDWSARWFARDQPMASAFGTMSRREWIAVAQDAYLLGDDLAVILAPDARQRLARLMLDGPDDEGSTGEADRPILDTLGEACLDDLKRRAAEHFRLDPGARWQTGDAPDAESMHGCTIIGPGGAVLFVLLASQDLLIALAKAGTVKRFDHAPLATLDAALARQPVTVTARLGRSAVTLGEVRGLAVGDVIVLDRTLDIPVDLGLEGVAAPVARCMVERSERGFALKLLDTIEVEGE